MRRVTILPVRRVARILFRAATGVSLVLCLAAVALWVRSQWYADYIWQNRAGTSIGVFVSRGSILVTRRRWAAHEPPQTAPWEFHLSRPPRELPKFVDDIYGPDHPRLLGFVTASSTSSRDVLVPVWAVATATALLPAWRAVGRARRRVQRRPGCCATCGYDLRATPERCPECGAEARGVRATSA